MKPRLCTLVVLSALVGCSSRSERPEQQAAASPAEQSETDEAPKPRLPRKFDVEGRLIPSNEYIVGIRLPQGVELFRADEVTHVYRMRAPIDKVLAYFGPMMITGNVERRGKGAVYKRASVRGAEVNPTKVDVSILEIGDGVFEVKSTNGDTFLGGEDFRDRAPATAHAHPWREPHQGCRPQHLAHARLRLFRVRRTRRTCTERRLRRASPQQSC